MNVVLSYARPSESSSYCMLNNLSEKSRKFFHALVTEEAYCLWTEAGCPVNDDWTFWFKAEEIIAGRYWLG